MKIKTLHLFSTTTSIITAHLNLKANHTQMHVYTNICTQRQLSIGKKKGPVVNIRGRHFQIHLSTKPHHLQEIIFILHLLLHRLTLHLNWNIHILSRPVYWQKKREKIQYVLHILQWIPLSFTNIWYNLFTCHRAHMSTHTWNTPSFSLSCVAPFKL